ncbi:elongation of very long chain fatty acids protein F-like [Drosophila nasuta]|uniref:elongation of very long chain fatty acids protein F-like n=1 Tax=Drosophila nasuta TaxID=42062 RepID=UPI00295E6762|nr:elongation of very long chain fatty acids protein F-like [Drosophila nasuta]
MEMSTQQCLTSLISTHPDYTCLNEMFPRLIELSDLPVADPVAAKFPFLGSAWLVTFLLISYLLIILKLGKKFMEHRKPYNINNILIVYNVFQMIYNVILFCMIVYYCIIKPTYDFTCMETLSFDHPRKNMERALSYAFFVNKIIDLLDTIFFVLRKSYKQITVLHVYHHVLMVFLPYWVVRFYGVGAQFVTTAFLNTFVHAVMYLYYMITAMYPGMKGSLWWKKYITVLQIIQFLIGMIQSAYILNFNPECDFPKIFHAIIIIGGAIFVAMFSNFYIRAYIMPQRRKLK